MHPQLFSLFCNPPMIVLHTARLSLRPLHADDIDTVTTLASDPRVMASLGGPLSATDGRTLSL